MPAADAEIDGSNPADLMQAILQRHVAMQLHESVAVTLWTLHTHAYEHFMVTPRLVLFSPVRGCGKTIALDALDALVARPQKTDSITAASIYHLVDANAPTLLIDEADNLGLRGATPLSAVLNSGHRRGGGVMRYIDGEARKFSTFAPAALAAIGTLPLPLMHRAIVIAMERHDGERNLQRLDNWTPPLRPTSTLFSVACAAGRRPSRSILIRQCRPSCATAPPTTGGRYRRRRCMRRAMGQGVRDAAVTFAASQQDEDAAVTLLRDIRYLFDERRVDRAASVAIVDALNALDDAPWSEWRGIGGDQQPRPLSLGELARLLAPFGIWPRTIRPRTTAREKTAKGYHRSQFEAAWRSYCVPAGTPAQPSDVRGLPAA